MHTRVYRYDLTYTIVKGNKHRNDTVIQEEKRKRGNRQHWIRAENWDYSTFRRALVSEGVETSCYTL